MIEKVDLNDIFKIAFVKYQRVKDLTGKEPDLPAIEECVDAAVDFLESDITDYDRDILIEKLEAIGVKQEAATFLIDEQTYENRDWYSSPSEMDRPYWENYKRYLIDSQSPVANGDFRMDSDTDLILRYLGDPKSNAPFDFRGLVIGRVQSGKTSNYIGLICKAADAGYNVIVLLTGVTEDLRRQTQKRIDEGFVGKTIDPEASVFRQVPVFKECGVGKLEDKSKKDCPDPIVATSTISDLTNNSNQNTNCSPNISGNRPILFVCKKQIQVLDRIRRFLIANNKSRLQNGVLDGSLLLIDDEADNASINTKKNTKDDDPTKTNGQIRKLLDTFKRHSYVAFTATPFANVFINPNTESDEWGHDLFPENFIVALNTPSNYLGSHEYFYPEGKMYSSVIKIPEIELEKGPLRITLKKDDDVPDLPDSLKEAIGVFCLATTLAHISGFPENSSMMVNASRFQNVHNKVKRLIDREIENLKNAAFGFGTFDPNEADKNPTIWRLHKLFHDQYPKCKTPWVKVLNNLFEAIRQIKVFAVNSSAKKREGLSSARYKIIVGGDALSRGLTLDGLQVAYFSRYSSTYDVLMQMGRWFGYRDGYEDKVRIYVPADVIEWYQQVDRATSGLIEDIQRMNELKKTPRQFGIRVQEEGGRLGITARNKMRNTDIGSNSKKSPFGSMYEVTEIELNKESNIKNLELTKNLVVGLEKDPSVDKGAIYFRDVKYDLVANYLKNFRFAPQLKLGWAEISRFVNSDLKRVAKKWDVLLMTRNISSGETYSLGDGLEIVCKRRQMTLSKKQFGYVLTVAGKSKHIGEPDDTRLGLSKEKIEEIRMQFLEETPYEVNEDSELRSQVAYLYEGRNPLLIIYLLEFKQILLPENAPPFPFEGSTITQDNATQIIENYFGGQPLVAFEVGFPKSSTATEYKTFRYNIYVPYQEPDEDIYDGDDV